MQMSCGGCAVEVCHRCVVWACRGWRGPSSPGEMPQVPGVSAVGPLDPAHHGTCLIPVRVELRPQCPHSPPATSLGSRAGRPWAGICWSSAGWRSLGRPSTPHPPILPFYNGVQVVFGVTSDTASAQPLPENMQDTA